MKNLQESISDPNGTSEPTAPMQEQLPTNLDSPTENSEESGDELKKASGPTETSLKEDTNYEDVGSSLYEISVYEDQYDNVPRRVETTWDGFCENLSHHQVSNQKEGQLISGATYPPLVWRRDGKKKEQIFSPKNDSPLDFRPPIRLNDYVEKISMGLLDVENGTMSDKLTSFIGCLNNGAGAAAFLHTTHRHDPTTGGHRYRIVIPFKSPVTREEFPSVFERLQVAFDNAIDSKTKDPSRMYFMPMSREDLSEHAMHKRLFGPPLDVTTLPPAPKRPQGQEPSEVASFDGNGASKDAYALKVFESEINRFLTTKENRNSTLNDVAFKLGQYVGAGRLSRNEVEDALMSAANVNGYVSKDGEFEARKTMNSGLNSGQREPKWNGQPKQIKPTQYEFELRGLNDIEAQPRAEWLVKSLLVEKTISVISADSGSFKSFIALDMGLCIATGTPFHGCNVKSGPVIYVLGEGDYTVKDRCKAWLQEHGLEHPQNFQFLFTPLELGKSEVVEAFAEEVAQMKPSFIILDTLSHCATGLGENDNDDMALFTSAMKELGEKTGAHVTVLHHNSKAGGLRGAGAIHANIDTHISLDRPAKDATNTVFVRCEKQRGKEFAPFALRGEEILLPYTDEYGDEVTSLVFHAVGVGEIAEKKHANAKRANKTQERLLEVFDSLARDFPKGVKVGHWLAAVQKAEPKICSSKTFWDSRTKFVENGIIENCGKDGPSPLYKRKTNTSSTSPES